VLFSSPELLLVGAPLAGIFSQRKGSADRRSSLIATAPFSPWCVRTRGGCRSSLLAALPGPSISLFGLRPSRTQMMFNSPQDQL